MSDAEALLGYFTGALDDGLKALERLVQLESFSADKPGVDALATHVTGAFRSLGLECEILPSPGSGNGVRAVWPGGGSPVLVLGHLDTVWPRGTLIRRPFRIQDGRAYGPGVYDMKAGILLSLLACRAYRDRVSEPGRRVVFLFTPDEESGSGAGLSFIAETAPGCAACLCLEPPAAAGEVKTARKGLGEYRIRVEGIPAHAGIEPERGANAILALCDLLLRLEGIADAAQGTTVNAGLIRGGTAVNVVADWAEAELDVRFLTEEQGRLVEDRIKRLLPSDSRCTLRIQGGMTHPPLQRTRQIVELFGKARQIAGELGMDLREAPSGGVSDGSHAAAMGIPTLDGLGVSGEGAHQENECIEIQDIPRRAALLCRLIQSV